MAKTLSEIVSGIVVFDALPATPGEQETWIKLMPVGTFETRDGRTFHCSPEVVINRFNADNIPLPVDLDHETARSRKGGDTAPAYGWIEELKAESDGIYGRVNWLAEGKKVLAAKTHRFISPALETDGYNNITWLHSAGLVAAPALSMPAVASAMPQSTPKGTTEMELKTIAAALGLADTATLDEIVQAILVLRRQQNETAALSAAFEGLSVGMGKEAQAEQERRRDQKIETALSQGVFAPALRDWATNLIRTNETAFDEFCAKIGKPMAYLMRSSVSDDKLHTFNSTINNRRDVATQSEASKVASLLGIDPKKLD